MYIWQNDAWPHLSWREEALGPLLAEVNRLRGELFGRLAMTGIGQQDASMLDALTHEVADSAQIEGLSLNRDSVRSSLARHLGIEAAGLPHPDHYTDGVVQVLLDATQHYDAPLSAQHPWA